MMIADRKVFYRIFFPDTLTLYFSFPLTLLHPYAKIGLFPAFQRYVKRRIYHIDWGADEKIVFDQKWKMSKANDVGFRVALPDLQTDCTR